MNYKDCRDAVCGLIGVVESAKWKTKMLQPFNAALSQISQVKYILKQFTLTAVLGDLKIDGHSNWQQLSLPTDFYLFQRLLLDGSPYPKYYLTNDNKIAVPYDFAGNLTLEYAAFPKKMLVDTPDEYVFDIPLDVHIAIAPYVASKLALTSNPDIYGDLNQEFIDIMTNLKIPKKTAKFVRNSFM